MTRALYIDNQRVDLPEDVRFQLTFQIADFGELKPRGSGSNTIKLPKTPRNVAIFQNCNFVQVKSDFPYAMHSAYYYEDGWLVFNDATVYVLAITDTDFEIQCVWGNSNAIRQMKDTDMSTIADLGNVNYQPVTYGYIETGIRGTYGYSEPFALATKNGLRSPYTRGLLNVYNALVRIMPTNTMVLGPGVSSYLNHLYAFPAVQKAKITYQDAVFNGEISQNLNTNPTEWLNFVYDSTNKISTLSKDPAERRKAFMKIGNTDRTVTTQGGTPFDGVVAPFTLPGGWYDVSVEITEIMFQNPADGGITSQYGEDRNITKAVFVLGQILASDDNTQYTAESDSSLVVNIDSDWWRKGKTYSGSKRIYIDDTAIDMGNGVSAIPQLYCALWPTYRYDRLTSAGPVKNAAVSGKVKITMSAVGGLNEVEIKMPDETTEGVKNYVTVAMTDLLRGTNAYDFFTQALINTGAIFDIKNGYLRIYTYNDIANATDRMQDWSDKLVYIKEEDTFNQSGGSQNGIKYKQTEYYNGYGDGAYGDALAQQLDKENKTVVENSLFGFNNGFFKLGNWNTMFIPFVEEKADKDGTKSYEYKDRGWNLVRLSDSDNGALSNGEGRTVQSRYPVKAIDQKQPTFENIEATNWASFVKIQQNYRKAKAIFMLSPQDIAELDLMNPIYLRQYAQAYIVTKVNYKRNATIVEMLLIR